MCHSKLLKYLFFIMAPLLLLANPYEQNCLECHGDAEQQMGVFFGRYLIQYSSERKVKKALYDYLSDPTYQKSVMPMGFLNRFGIKEKSDLSNKDLKEAIDTYYKNFAPKYRLK